MNASTLTVLAVASIVALALFMVAIARRRTSRRQLAMRQLLDAADALEARLRAARSEIEAVAGEDIEDPVQDAMREMLRQRLWLREHGEEASIRELQQVRSSINEARTRIEQQLIQIERARAPLA